MAVLAYKGSDVKKIVFNGIMLNKAYLGNDTAYEGWNGVVALPNVVNPSVSVTSGTGSSEKGAGYFKPIISFYGYDGSNWGTCSSSMSGTANTAVLDIKDLSRTTIAISGLWGTRHYAYVSENSYSASMAIRISDGKITKTVGSASSAARNTSVPFNYVVDVSDMDRSKLYLKFTAGWYMSYEVNAPGTWYFDGYVNISVNSIVCT